MLDEPNVLLEVTRDAEAEEERVVDEDPSEKAEEEPLVPLDERIDGDDEGVTAAADEEFDRENVEEVASDDVPLADEAADTCDDGSKEEEATDEDKVPLMDVEDEGNAFDEETEAAALEDGEALDEFDATALDETKATAFDEGD